MHAIRGLPFAILMVASAGCEDHAVPSGSPSHPPPSPKAIQVYLQVDDDRGRPGDRIRVFVAVRIGTERDVRLGSYTGRLRFDPRALRWRDHARIDDGLRVVNPSGAADGEIRFAGASAGGFEDLVLYEGEFDVRRSNYLRGLTLEMEELAAALTLADLRPVLEVVPNVFLRAPVDSSPAPERPLPAGNDATPGRGGRTSLHAPDRIRTCDLWLRRPTLYPTELLAPAAGRAGALAQECAGEPWASASSSDRGARI